MNFIRKFSRVSYAGLRPFATGKSRSGRVNVPTGEYSDAGYGGSRGENVQKQKRDQGKQEKNQSPRNKRGDGGDSGLGRSDSSSGDR